MKHSFGLQVRVLVVEDHEAFLDFVCATLEEQPSLEIVGQARNGADGVRQAEDLQPDLIFLDIGLPGLNGIAAAHRICEVAPGSRIIFLTQECSQDLIEEAFMLGAWGYIHKLHARNDIPLAVSAVTGGSKFLGTGLEQYEPAHHASPGTFH